MKFIILTAILLTVSASAQITFQRTYGGTRQDYGRSVAQTAEGGYVVVGRTSSFGAGGADVWVVRTDAIGDTVWTRAFGGPSTEFGNSVIQSADGGYVITAATKSFGAGGYDVWLIKTDAHGDTMWTRTFGGDGGDHGRSVSQTSDGGYIIAGETVSFGAGDYDVYLVKTDAAGDTMWTRTYGGTSIDIGYSVQQTTDGGYIIAGATSSFGAGHEDFWFIKTDSLGRVGIAEHPPTGIEPLTLPTVMRASDLARVEGRILDMQGRNVTDERRNLSPGVYFIRPSSAQSAVGKIVLTR